LVKFRAEGDRLEFYRWGCEPSPDAGRWPGGKGIGGAGAAVSGSYLASLPRLPCAPRVRAGVSWAEAARVSASAAVIMSAA
jgi:hypothetical protein